MRLLRRIPRAALLFLGMSRAWVSFLPSRSGSEYTAAAIAALRWGAKKYVFLKPLTLEPVPSAYLGRAAAKSGALWQHNPSTAVSACFQAAPGL